MAHDAKLSDILNNSGFKRIAKAIRQSTIIPQRAKAERNRPDNKRPSNPYDIRYGLGAELMRNAAYPDKFAQTLSHFLYAYNQETFQIYERFDGKPPIRRIQISEDDIEQVIALMSDYHDSETVASLLVACGYASNGKAKEAPQDPSDIAEPAESDEDFEIDSDPDDEE